VANNPLDNVFGSIGESRLSLELYLTRTRGREDRDAQDLVANSKTYSDRNAAAGRAADAAMTVDNSNRWLTRFTVQQVVLLAMEDMHLDAMVSPTGNIRRMCSVNRSSPALNGRGPSIWSFLGTQGFPELGVPAGFTTRVFDRVRDASAPRRYASDRTGARKACRCRLMSSAVPFSEPTLLQIAAAYGERDAPSRAAARFRRTKDNNPTKNISTAEERRTLRLPRCEPRDSTAGRRQPADIRPNSKTRHE